MLRPNLGTDKCEKWSIVLNEIYETIIVITSANTVIKRHNYCDVVLIVVNILLISNV